ncbi:type VII secretion protein EccB [Mycobacterium simiae]|uniref:Type VII secretion protein EccB n=1 Tax=Mycobacterium simiae TaxID=1784 RepID=A0A5B1BI87_MYCSI|nr:type VII secretion protein EccB [Mycobacterium simiae]KAA1248367.1 type VII secretion protein EccB [Mycobacterium simiae]
MWLQVSAYRFQLRRLERALLCRDLRNVNWVSRAAPAALTVGCVLATVMVAGCVVVALLRPQPGLGGAQLVMGRESGALYVRVGETWHPVLNLASARLIAATNVNPRLVRDADLRDIQRGPLLGIAGAPQLIGRSLTADEATWTMCDGDRSAATTVLAGPVGDPSVRRLAPDATMLVASAPASPTYLLYQGHRAVVDLGDRVVVRALRLEQRAPRLVSQSLLNAVPEAPPITVPRISRAGERSQAGVPGFAIGTVVTITRADGVEFYVVLSGGVQRIGQVAADLLRLSDSQGATDFIAVAPDVIRAAVMVNTLPVATFPDRVSALSDGSDTTFCLTWSLSGPGRPDIAFLAGPRLPLPAGAAPVTLAQADGRGPALDAVYLPPGRSAYVAVHSLTGDGAQAGSRYLVTDSGVRFAVHDDQAAHHLGLPAAVPAPWPILAALPSGPELSREKASAAHDGVLTGPS